MGRKSKLNDSVLVTLYMERLRVEQLKRLSKEASIPYSQLIRDAVDDKYGALEFEKVHELPKSIRRAINVIGLLHVECHSGNKKDIFLSRGNLIGVTDVDGWSTLEGIMDLVREILTLKGWSGVVIEDKTQAYPVGGAVGRPRVTHEGFEVHAPDDKPFSSKEMSDLTTTLEKEYRALGRFIKQGGN